MKNIKRILAVALPLLFATCMYGQKNYKLTGKIISATNKPIADAVVSVQDTLNATTKADGEFTFKLRDKSGVISVWAPGYLPVRQLLNGRTEVVIMMISDSISTTSKLYCPSGEIIRKFPIILLQQILPKKIFFWEALRLTGLWQDK